MENPFAAFAKSSAYTFDANSPFEIDREGESQIECVEECNHTDNISNMPFNLSGTPVIEPTHSSDGYYEYGVFEKTHLKQLNKNNELYPDINRISSWDNFEYDNRRFDLQKSIGFKFHPLCDVNQIVIALIGDSDLDSAEAKDIREHASDYHYKLPDAASVGLNKYELVDYLSWNSDYHTNSCFREISIKTTDNAVNVLLDLKQLYLIVGYGPMMPYVFVAETNDGSLYLLHDQDCQKLNKPLEYYVKNITTYYHLVCESVGPYFDYIDSVVHKLDSYNMNFELYIRRFGYQDTDEQLYQMFHDMYPQIEKQNMAKTMLNKDMLHKTISPKSDGCFVTMSANCMLFIDPFTGQTIPLNNCNSYTLHKGIDINAMSMSSVSHMLKEHYLSLYRELSKCREYRFVCPADVPYNAISVDIKTGLFSNDELLDWKTNKLSKDGGVSLLKKCRDLKDIYSHGEISFWVDDIFAYYNVNAVTQ